MTLNELEQLSLNPPQISQIDELFMMDLPLFGMTLLGVSEEDIITQFEQVLKKRVVELIESQFHQVFKRGK